MSMVACKIFSSSLYASARPRLQLNAFLSLISSYTTDDAFRDNFWNSDRRRTSFDRGSRRRSLRRPPAGHGSLHPHTHPPLNGCVDKQTDYCANLTASAACSSALQRSADAPRKLCRASYGWFYRSPVAATALRRVLRFAPSCNSLLTTPSRQQVRQRHIPVSPDARQPESEGLHTIPHYRAFCRAYTPAPPYPRPVEPRRYDHRLRAMPSSK